jgi:broad specificity phosphatase PhoE
VGGSGPPGGGQAARPADHGGGRQAVGPLVLVRHGETEWSRGGRHTGRTDLPLTPFGEEQAVALGAALRRVLGGREPALVLASPRVRALRTAELAGLPAEAEPDLVEWDYGRYEGLTTPEIRRERPEWTIWTGDPPGGETAAQVGARVDRLLARVRGALSAGPVVVFTHGHAGRVVAARYLGLPVDCGRLFALDPAAPCVLGTEHANPVILRWNMPNPVDP